MRSLAILSMHTSPLAQPGTGDGGGMNVYVRELATALARAGVAADVYTRAEDPSQPPVVRVEPGFRVHHVPAGPDAPLDKAELPFVVDEFAHGVVTLLEHNPADAIHANYWLSGIAGHEIKHRLDLPLVSTFHTLDRVKAEDSDDPGDRAEAEAAIIGCSDAILASCDVEANQLRDLYDADPSRIEIVAPGVDHAFFAPGDRRQARRALGFDEDGPLLLFVGRIQPLKGLDVAIHTLARIADTRTRLIVVGGPSGPLGEDEVIRMHKLVADLGVTHRVHFVPPQRHELLSTFYRAADVTLVPSRSESFGLVALEAAACGTPVVACAVGGLTTLVDHGDTGFLVDGRDPDAFAAFTTELLDNPARAAQFSARAARRAQRYTWSVAAGRLRRLYTDLTSRQLVDCA
ncbi:MAG TPA: glycosyltransferase [Acidimicrobiales bacterium]|nr:glycosyltransferase [Acidimicrobiales bacterium]